MFVLATMSAAQASGPVKIRNMSASGALIEGASLPQAGESITLRRGDKAIAARIVWSEHGRAGLRFAGRATVRDWLPSAQSGQQDVDEAFQAVKSGEVVERMIAPTIGPFTSSDLRQLARAIDALADDLADDAAFISRHGTKLQALDVASQTLRKLASLG
jgi:hypothetical protein